MCSTSRDGSEHWASFRGILFTSLDSWSLGARAAICGVKETSPPAGIGMFCFSCKNPVVVSRAPRANARLPNDPRSSATSLRDPGEPEDREPCDA